MKRDERYVQRVMESCTNIDQLRNARQWFMSLEERGTVTNKTRVYLAGVLRGLLVGIKREAE